MTVIENSLFNLISEFRNHTRLKASRKLKHSTYSTFLIISQSDQLDQNKLSFKPQSAPQTPNQSRAFVARQQNESSPQHYYETLIIVIFFSAFSTPYFLQSSWILDNGSNTHICNKSMLHRFRKTKDVLTENILIGERKSNVKAFDEIDIIIFEFEGNPWKIIFRDVCYIFNFMINIAATGKFRVKKMYFDDQRMRLHANGRTFG